MDSAAKDRDRAGRPARRPLDELDIFVGEWIMTTSLVPDPADAPRARISFEWLTGRRFLMQRWEVEHPDAPDGSRSSAWTPPELATSSTISTRAGSSAS